jgi:hypothetical protein
MAALPAITAKHVTALNTIGSINDRLESYSTESFMLLPEKKFFNESICTLKQKTILLVER